MVRVLGIDDSSESSSEDETESDESYSGIALAHDNEQMNSSCNAEDGIQVDLGDATASQIHHGVQFDPDKADLKLLNKAENSAPAGQDVLM